MIHEKYLTGERVRFYKDGDVREGVVDRITSNNDGTFSYDIVSTDHLALIALDVGEFDIIPCRKVVIDYKKTTSDFYSSEVYNHETCLHIHDIIDKFENSMTTGELVSLRITYDFEEV